MREYNARPAIPHDMLAIGAPLLYLSCAGITLILIARVIRISRFAAIVLVLLPLVLTGRALLTGGVYAPIDIAYGWEPFATVADVAGVRSVTNPGLTDMNMEFVPWNAALRAAVARGEWPLWNPYELAGSPLAGAAQAAPYHPITVAGLLLSMPAYFGFAAAMMYLIAAAGAFAFARDLDSDEVPSLIAAAAWMASSHLVFFAGTALGNAFSVMPLVILGARRIAREPGKRSFALLTVSLVLLVLSGHPETALHVVALAVIWFGAESFAHRHANWRRAVFAGFASGITALLLTAFFLLPHLEVIEQSQELRHRAATERRRSSTGAQMLHYITVNLFPFVEGAAGIEERRHPPNLRHGTMPSTYAGSIVVPLALAGVLRSRKRERWLLAAIAAFGFATAIVAPGVTHLLNVLPGFEIAVNERMAAFAVFALSVLAALGVQAIGAKKTLLTAMASMLVLVLIAASNAPAGISIAYVRSGAARAALPLVLAMASIALLHARHSVRILLVVLLIARAGETAAVQPTIDPRAFYPPFPGLDLLRTPEPARFVAVGQIMPPALSTMYGLEDVRGFQAVTLARFDALYEFWSVRQPVWFNRVDDLGSPLLSLMNVKFALVPHGQVIPPTWRRTAEFARYDVAENLRALPRAFVPSRVHHMVFAEDSLAFTGRTTDFAADSAIESGELSGIDANEGSVTLSGAGSHLRLNARMSRPGWIVVSIAAWKGWQARIVGGSKIRLRPANHAFLAMNVPAGTHDIEMVYRPRSFVNGSIISITTLLIVLGAALPSRRRKPAVEPS